ncbi:MAG: Rid family detoxifying hydrolase [Candidatus Eisenbacteria bacterium]|uniref:Rid family detoxifying hydrolase n=1 Tax=Eiseniibacteriota bacterium TaxID=2212470 RepID=A0A948W5X3_UNCEI|nr:Rid family detoxifying hydrolase [Candidatus Eisenbacteria bacterium]MBU1949166.1 Rid family detoxifying hydrolase [Candidatus Eisenbacteria bacterium]MBU2690490.1 Rid family detoxifying hydrolase [Candidatus Eisenbacteria bacterium]
MSYRTIQTGGAPAAVGPYSQGVVAGDLLFTAMQIALDPATGEMLGETAGDQARQCLRNIKVIVEAGGSRMDRVVKTTIYLTDISEFGNVNAIYAEFFETALPSRGVLEVSALPKGALVAVEAVAAIG